MFLGLSAGVLRAGDGSLWGTVIVQAALTVWMLHLTARTLGVEDTPCRLVLTVVALTLLTGLPWYTAQIMPDILEPLMVLALHLLAFCRPALNRGEKGGLVAVVALAVACHMAHLGLALGLLTVIAAGRWLMKPGQGGGVMISVSLPAAAIAGGVAALLTLNAVLAGHLGFTPGGESFIFGRLVQDGIAKRFLDEHCAEESYRLCAYRDRLPHTADDWIWGKDSPFMAIGGWENGGPEMARITRAALIAYPLANLGSALASTWEQGTRVRVGVGLTEWHGHTIAMMKERLPGHNSAYQASRQQRHELDFAALNLIQVPVAFGALVLTALGAAVLGRRRQQTELALFGGFITVALLGNAFICGALSNPNDRYQNRLIWLAVFCLILMIRNRGSSSQVTYRMARWYDFVNDAKNSHFVVKSERPPELADGRSEEQWHAKNAVPPCAPVAFMAD